MRNRKTKRSVHSSWYAQHQAWARTHNRPYDRTVDLDGVAPVRAVLTGADLKVADLTGAVLTDAVLMGAVLWCANLWDADLTGAVLTDADLTGAVLLGTKGVKARRDAG